jgi:alcohol dehydrogenase (NADP+)
MSGTDAVPASVQIHDYTHLKQLSDEQKAELRQLEHEQQHSADGSDVGYRVKDNQPTAKLLSGYSIPLVGLGTW